MFPISPLLRTCWHGEFHPKPSRFISVLAFSRTRAVLSFVFLFYFSSPSNANSQEKIFIRDYTYQSGEADSKLTARSIALEQTKKLLLQEVGSYIEAEVILTVKIAGNRQSENLSETIRHVTAGITQTKILQESWNGEVFYLKAEIKLNPQEIKDQLQAALNNINTRQTVEDREKQLRQKADSALAEVERLKQALEHAQASEKPQLKKRFEDVAQSLTEKELFDIGLESYYRKEYLTAEQLFSQVIGLNPGNAFAYHARGSTRYFLSKMQAAYTDFSEAIRLDSMYLWFFNERGLVRHEKGDFQGAIEDFSRALKLDPFNAIVLYNRGRSYLELEILDEAIKDNTASLALDPTYTMSFNNRALARLKKYDYEGGISDIVSAMTLEPDNPLLHYNLACAYSLMNSSKKALASLGKALELGFRDSELLHNDSDLDHIRSLPAFKQLLKKYFPKRTSSR